MYPDKLVVPGLSDQEQDDLNACLVQLRGRSRRNKLRAGYYDAEQVIEHLGIAIPPQLQNIEAVVGWPAKAVNTLEHRLNFQGWTHPELDMSDLGLDVFYEQNNLDVEVPQGNRTALTFGCSFKAVLAGTEAGEPDVIYRNLSPRSSTVLWDSLRRRARVGLSVTRYDSTGHPDEFILYTDEFVITAEFSAGRWRVEHAPHDLGRCPVAVGRFQPSVERPLGRSRITRPVMAITDRVVRTLVRMEVGGEFYIAPRSVLLGADTDVFDGVPGWAAYLSKINIVPLNEADGVPNLETLPQMSMTPHIEMLRSDAGLFAGETDIPVHLLGVIHDNPASDAAMHTSYLELVTTAGRAHATLGAGELDAARMAVAIREGIPVDDPVLNGLRPHYSAPTTPPLGAAADGIYKLIESQVLPAESDVTAELLGLSASQIERIKSDRRKSAGSALYADLIAAAGNAPAEDPAPAV